MRALGIVTFALGIAVGLSAEPCHASGPIFGFDDTFQVGTWDVTIRAAETPLPAALPLFATGLGALGLFGWRRKKKAPALVMRGLWTALFVRSKIVRYLFLGAMAALLIGPSISLPGSSTATAATFNFSAIVTNVSTGASPVSPNLNVQEVFPNEIVTGQISYDETQAPLSSTSTTAVYPNVSITATVTVNHLGVPIGPFSISPNSPNYQLTGAIVVENGINDSITFKPQTLSTTVREINLSLSEETTSKFSWEFQLLGQSASVFSNTNLPSTLSLSDFQSGSFSISDSVVVQLVLAVTGDKNLVDSDETHISGGFLSLSADTPAVPLPAALPLFAGGLGALGLLGWRRKRKA